MHKEPPPRHTLPSGEAAAVDTSAPAQQKTASLADQQPAEKLGAEKLGAEKQPAEKQLAEQQDEFLAELRLSGNVTAAARAAGRDRRCFYRDRQNNTEFAFAWLDALEEATDRLEGEAVRRAVSGIDEQRFYQGSEIGSVTRYSDALLMFLLRARRPWRFDPQGRGGAVETDSQDNDDAIRDEIERKMARLTRRHDTG